MGQPVSDLRIPAIRAKLRRADFPPDVITLDFETYYDSTVNLRKMSTVEYVNHPDFHVTALAIKVNDDATECVHGEDVFYRLNKLQQQAGTYLDRYTVLAQNARFDGYILARRFGILPKFPVDLLGVSRHINARAKNDLASVAKRCGLTPKGDTSRFKGLSTDDLVGDAWGEMADYCTHDVDLTWQAFLRLFPKFTRPKFELLIMRHTLEMFWRPMLEVDFEKAAELKERMTEEMQAAVGQVGVDEKTLRSTNAFHALLTEAIEETWDDPDFYMKQGKKGKMFALAKDDPQREQLENHGNDTVRDLVNARSAVKSWPLHIARVDRIANQARAHDGQLCVPLGYHGAWTGRWAGGEKINPQNLSSRSPYDVLNEIRHLIVAPDGYKLVITDASQVEARVAATLAGQQDMMDLFASGSEIYCAYAQKMTKHPLRKPRDSDPTPVRKYLKRMRDMGKVQVLGGQYGMGWMKCQAFAKNTYGVELTPEEAQTLIRSYRDSVPRITATWRKLESEFKRAIRDGHGEAAGMSIDRIGSDTLITLPSGRKLRYCGAKIEWSPDGESIIVPGQLGSQKVYLWGGALLENVTQAVCRDLLAEAMLECEAQGIPVKLHVHDEVIACVPAEEAESALQTVVQIMSTPPAWAEGYPLAAEGVISERYQK